MAEFMWNENEAEPFGWVQRDDTDAEEALRLARVDLDLEPGTILRAVPVLMREESEVEANINGHEFPFYVECTKRARHPEPYWRIESAEASRG